MALFSGFAEACEAIADTRKKSEKVRLLAAYFKSLEPADASLAAI